MDPNECIRTALRAIDREDGNALNQALADYRQWIRNGGFAASPELLERLDVAMGA